ncbi:MAG TPA: 4-hydroxy-tetrahydrodipicolinate synthase [Steroidobacteraceae bacterium]|nr:4-hydroxy-tetrahydrodipicolinate synthase [Steroidobacteraceae bacterium]
MTTTFADRLQRLKGSMPPLVTPFRGGAVDYDAYGELVAFQIENGTHGIVVNGTTAEPSTLSVEERNRLVDVAVAVAAKRVPVVAATGTQSLADSLQLTEHAARAGADALLIVTPYFIKPPQRGLIAYYLELASRSDLPWMVYHIPGRAAVSVTIDTLKTLKERSSTFIGMKHAVNDLGFVSECFAELGRDFRVFVGLEELSFPMMAVGACGLMNAVGNLQPRVLADLCDAVWRNDLARAQALHHRLFEINQAVFFDTNPIPIKYMMKRLGLLAANEHRLPMAPATPELERRLDAVLDRAGLLAEPAKLPSDRTGAQRGRSTR